MIAIRGIAAANVTASRGRLWPFLENFAARSDGRWTAEELWAAIRCQDKQVWVVGDYQAVVLTSVGPDWVNIDHCAGFGRGEWQSAVDDEVTAWARSMGKRRIFALVRPGWAKFGRMRGWKEIHREMVKDL